MKPKAGTKAPNPRENAWRLFLLTHTVILERIEARLAQAQLPPLGWYDVLWELDRAESGKLRMSELAERVVLSRSSLTRLADRLERAQLIARERCADDRRGAYCAITRAGAEMRRKMWPVYRRAIEEFFGRNLKDEEIRPVTAALARMLDTGSRRGPASPPDAKVSAKKDAS